MVGRFADDEVSLIDLWLVLKRRKVLFGVAFLTPLALAGALILVLSPVYQVRAVLDVGKIALSDNDINGEPRYIENPEVLTQRLRTEYHVGAGGGSVRHAPLISRVENITHSVFSITARGAKAQETQAFLMGVVGKIVKGHQALFKRNEALGKTFSAFLDAKLTEINGLIDTLSREIPSISKTHPTQASVLEIQKTGLLAEKLKLELLQRSIELKYALIADELKPTTLLSTVPLPVTQVRPQPKVYLMVGAFMGLVLGLLAVFVAEFVSNARHVEEASGRSAP